MDTPGLYAYLLGMYLGDGCVVRMPRTACLDVACDAQYPAIITRVAAAMTALAPNKVGLHEQRDCRCVHVRCYWKGWYDLFPQHGPGRKHERPIVLEGWQWEIVRQHPWEMLRGLLESDGCRSINRVKTILPSGRYAVYEYPRWYFVNASEDILGIFRSTCEILGLKCTRSRQRMITVSSRPSVALIDRHIGPKDSNPAVSLAA